MDNAFKYVVLTPIPPGVAVFMEENGPGIPIQERAIVLERGIRIVQGPTIYGGRSNDCPFLDGNHGWYIGYR